MDIVAATRAVLLASVFFLAASCSPGDEAGRDTADRGIGGTGEPARTVADRGIGGTGIGMTGTESAGIVGTITGFGSVIVNGLEVRFNRTAPVFVDGQQEDADVLQVGQMTAIEAVWRLDGLDAARIAVRHEIVGPIEAVDPGMLRVAGQAVAVTETVPGAAGLRPGQWVAVSGLRTPGGRVIATRIDPRPPGRALIHGRLEQEPSRAWRIGGARVELPRGADPVAGQVVEVSGTYRDGTLHAAALQPDLLASDPAAYFGAVSRLSVERYASAGASSVALGDQAYPATGVAGDGPVIVNLVRGENGRFTPASIGPSGGWSAPGGGGPGGGTGTPGIGPGGGGRFSPAPMPSPGSGPNGGMGGGGWGGGGRGNGPGAMLPGGGMPPGGVARPGFAGGGGGGGPPPGPPR